MVSAIILTILASLFYLSENPTSLEVIQRLEALPYDMRLKLSTPFRVDDTPPIIIIDIDEASLKQDGRWPWSRKKLAQLIEKLYQSNTALIMLDVVQSEKEVNPTFKLQEALTKMKKPLPDWFSEVEKKLDADAYFSKIIKGKELVLGFPFHSELTTQTGLLHKSSIKSDTKEIHLLTALDMKGFTSNLVEFTNNAVGSGFINITSGSDGVVRHAPIIATFNNNIYPSLALETARLYLMEETAQLHTASIKDVRTITHISLGKKIIRTNAQGQILIPFLGKRKHFTYISASRILHTNKTFPELENAIAIIGTSAIALADLRATPVQAEFPGVEIQATVLHGILHPESISFTPDWIDGGTTVLLALLCVFMTLLYPTLQPLSLVLSGTALLFIMFSFNYWLWATHHLNLPIVMPMLLIMTVSSIYIIHNLFKENQGRRKIHDMFGQYVPLEHINKLIDHPKKISTDGDKREMTVLFSDIRNFTSLSEPLSTIELKSFLNMYLTPITKIIFDNQGTIDKYVGDMVMAFWGAPLDDPQHASQAVTAALKIQKKITTMQHSFSQIGIGHVAAGIGIHTGEMNVGDMGSDYRRAYTVLGDAVNLGSRLESLTKFYGVKILVSEETKKQCPDILFQYIDYVRVKGKLAAIKIYQPILLKTAITKSQAKQLETHELAFKHYLQGDWNKASLLFAQLLEQLYKQPQKQHTNENNQILYQIYLDRISHYAGTPPSDWDTIFTHSTK